MSADSPEELVNAFWAAVEDARDGVAGTKSTLDVLQARASLMAALDERERMAAEIQALREVIASLDRVIAMHEAAARDSHARLDGADDA